MNRGRVENLIFFLALRSFLLAVSFLEGFTASYPKGGMEVMGCTVDVFDCESFENSI